MGAATTLPSKFARIEYDVPPPLPDELEYIERPTLILDDAELGFEPPPPTPANFLEPPQELLNLKPVAPSSAHALPVLNLPLQASLRMPSDVKPSPNSSESAREAWIMRPAIDVPTGPEKQAGSLSVSSPVSNTANDLANETHSSASSADGETRNKNPSPRIGDQDAAHEMASRLFSPSLLSSGAPPQWFNDIVNAGNRGGSPKTLLAASEVSMPVTSTFAPAAVGLNFVPPSPTSETFPVAATGDLSISGASGSTSRRRTAPAWLTDVLTTPNPRISPELAIVDSEVPMSAPSMFASASAGLTFQTWRYGIPAPRRTLRTAAPFARPVAMAANQAKPRKKPAMTKRVPGQAAQDLEETPLPNPQ